jgi:hypothetical protein
MRRSNLLKLRKLESSWQSIKKKTKDDLDPQLTFVVTWLNELEATLRKYRNDNEFIADIVATAAVFYLSNMSHEEKTDAFTYLLGKTVRKF